MAMVLASGVVLGAAALESLGLVHVAVAVVWSINAFLWALLDWSK